jgi:hypothetical protein
LILFFFLLFTNCNEKLKENFIQTKIISNNVYIEIYETKANQGVFASSYFSYFLTDSNNINVFIDEVDDDYGFDFNVQTDVLIVMKYKKVFEGFNVKKKKEYEEIFGFNLNSGKKIN